MFFTFVITEDFAILEEIKELIAR